MRSARMLHRSSHPSRRVSAHERSHQSQPPLPPPQQGRDRLALLVSSHPWTSTSALRSAASRYLAQSARFRGQYRFLAGFRQAATARHDRQALLRLSLQKGHPGTRLLLREQPTSVAKRRSLHGHPEMARQSAQRFSQDAPGRVALLREQYVFPSVAIPEVDQLEFP